MKKLILFTALLIILISDPAQAQSVLPENKFRDYFTVTDTITIPEDFLLSSISHVSVWRDSLMVLTDQHGGAWYKVDLLTGSVSQLDPESCFPGFKSTPLGAHILSDGKIFVSSAQNYQGYIFEKDGTCFDIADREYLSAFPQQTAVGPHNTLYQISFLNPDGEPEISKMDQIGKRTERMAMDSPGFPEFTRDFRGGGITVTEDGWIWYSYPALSQIYGVDPNTGKKIAPETQHPDYLKPPIQQDMPEATAPVQLMKFMQGLQSDHSWNGYFGKLNERTLLSQMVQNEEGKTVYYLILYDRVNKTYFQPRMALPEPILFSGNNRIYTYITQENSSNENPAIGVLTWTGSTKH